MIRHSVAKTPFLVTHAPTLYHTRTSRSEEVPVVHHASIRIAVNTYGHLLKQTAENAAGRLDETVFGEPPNAQSAANAAQRNRPDFAPLDDTTPTRVGEEKHFGGNSHPPTCCFAGGR